MLEVSLPLFQLFQGLKFIGTILCFIVISFYAHSWAIIESILRVIFVLACLISFTFSFAPNVSLFEIKIALHSWYKWVKNKLGIDFCNLFLLFFIQFLSLGDFNFFRKGGQLFIVFIVRLIVTYISLLVKINVLLLFALIYFPMFLDVFFVVRIVPT